MKKLERIQVAANMVDISLIIMQDVFYDYCKKFADEYRPFNRTKESQENWTKSLFDTYGNQIKEDREFLFKSIPNRFHKTIIYKKLSSKF